MLTPRHTSLQVQVTMTLLVYRFSNIGLTPSEVAANRGGGGSDPISA